MLDPEPMLTEPIPTEPKFTSPTIQAAQVTAANQSTSLEPYDAILLQSYGGPTGPETVLPFMRNATRGRGIPDERLIEVSKHYELFGGVSPINAANDRLLQALQEELRARVGDDQGVFTFVPAPGFLGNPTPIEYTAKSKSGAKTGNAKISVSYKVDELKTAASTSSGPQGVTQTSNKNGREMFSGVPRNAGAQYSLGSAGETEFNSDKGTFRIDPDSGVVTFVPIIEFVGDATAEVVMTTVNGDELTTTYTATVVPVLVPLPSLIEKAAKLGEPVTITPTFDESVNVGSIKIDGADGDGKTKQVTDQGTWTVDDAGKFTFTPAPGFKGNPAPISYTAKNQNGIQAAVMGQIAAIYPAATVTVTPAPPAPLPQATTTVTVTATPGTQPTSVPTRTATQVTSAPVSPAPTATTTVTVTAQPPVLEPGRLPDAQGLSLQRGVACTVSPRYELHGVDPKSVKFKENVGATLSADAKTMTVPCEGTWTVDPVNGNITFTPEPGFSGNPKKVRYTADDVLGAVLDDEGEIMGRAQLIMLEPLPQRPRAARR